MDDGLSSHLMEAKDSPRIVVVAEQDVTSQAFLRENRRTSRDVVQYQHMTVGDFKINDDNI